MVVNRIKIFKCLFLLIVVVVVTSCQFNTRTDKFRPVPIEKKSTTLNTEFYHIYYEHPVEIWDYKYEMQEFVESVVAYYKRDWSPGGMHYEEEMDNPERRTGVSYPKFELNIRFEKSEASKIEVHSYLFYIYIYTGGANGMTEVKSFNFDSNGLIKDDVFFDFNPRKLVELSQLFAEIARSMPDVFEMSYVREGLGLNYLMSDGITIDAAKSHADGFDYNSNFSTFILKDEGIRFYFNKYRLTPGAKGVPSIFLTWEQVNPYVRSRPKNKK
jgi:hypothetical protein